MSFERPIILIDTTYRFVSYVSVKSNQFSLKWCMFEMDRNVIPPKNNCHESKCHGLDAAVLHVDLHNTTSRHWQPAVISPAHAATTFPLCAWSWLPHYSSPLLPIPPTIVGRLSRQQKMRALCQWGEGCRDWVKLWEGHYEWMQNSENIGVCKSTV
jgi:hypothetical protein